MVLYSSHSTLHWFGRLVIRWSFEGWLSKLPFHIINFGEWCNIGTSSETILADNEFLPSHVGGCSSLSYLFPPFEGRRFSQIHWVLIHHELWVILEI